MILMCADDILFYLNTFIQKHILFVALLQSIVAVFGSLYFSVIKQYEPCVLCWYQRIFMFPLVLILVVGILRKDRGVYLYILPLSVSGMIVALYQVLLQLGVLPESATPCAIGVSCLTKYTNYFGFLSIPMMSLLSFSFLTVCFLIYRRYVLKKA